MAMLVLSTVPGFLRVRFLFVVFFVKMWFAWDFENLIFPVPVTLKRFAAPRFVFIFGIVFVLSSLFRNFKRQGGELLILWQKKSPWLK